jgi:hypothetical protein
LPFTAHAQQQPIPWQSDPGYSTIRQEKPMLKRTVFTIAFVGSLLSYFACALASELGSPNEARAMLIRAISEVKTNKIAAVEKFNHNEAPFRDRDLFVFCFNSGDGKLTAHEALVTWDVRKLLDARGTPFGAQMYNTAREGQIDEVVFISPIPGSTALAAKIAYISRIGDQVCGVSAFR